jgi:hypothetical protein
MKQFITRFLTAGAEATGGAVAVKTLEQLTAELTAARTAIKSASTDDEMDTATLTMLKIKSAINAFKSKAESEAKLAKVAELRNAEVKHIDDLIAAAHEHAIAKKDDKQAAADKLTELREAHINKALAKFVAPKALKVAGDGTAKVAGGNKTNEVFALFDAGKTYDEILAAGYADGTIRSAAWKGGYKKSNGAYVKG